MGPQFFYDVYVALQINVDYIEMKIYVTKNKTLKYVVIRGGNHYDEIETLTKKNLKPLKLHRYYINPCIFNASINPSDIVRQSLAV